jgi:hypothetical protein
MEYPTTEGRLIGHMVTFNELDRWLQLTIPALLEICDRVVVHDDDSTDGTIPYLHSQGVTVTDTPAVRFDADESRFRAAAWQSMEFAACPREGDTILCLDADEILVGDPRDLDLSAQPYALPVDEVFSFDSDGTPLIRTDGYWGDIRATRITPWRPDGQFESRPDAGGSIPTAWARAAVPVEQPRILHLGYARPEDRVRKYQRHSQKDGHNPHHVASILGTPTLKRWDGRLPALPGAHR